MYIYGVLQNKEYTCKLINFRRLNKAKILCEMVSDDVDGETKLAIQRAREVLIDAMKVQEKHYPIGSIFGGDKS